MHLHVSSKRAHHQEVKITLHRIWYHKKFTCDDTRDYYWCVYSVQCTVQSEIVIGVYSVECTVRLLLVCVKCTVYSETVIGVCTVYSETVIVVCKIHSAD